MREADFLGRSNNGEKEGTFFGCFIGFGFGGAWEPHRQAKPMQTVRKRKRRAGMFDRIPPPFLQPKVPSKVPRKFCKTFLIPIVLIPACQSEIYSVACLEPLSSEKHVIAYCTLAHISLFYSNVYKKARAKSMENAKDRWRRRTKHTPSIPFSAFNQFSFGIIQLSPKREGGRREEGSWV